MGFAQKKNKIHTSKECNSYFIHSVFKVVCFDIFLAHLSYADYAHVRLTSLAKIKFPRNLVGIGAVLARCITCLKTCENPNTFAAATQNLSIWT